MNDHQHEQHQNEIEENVSFDFWKTNHSGRLEKSIHLQDSSVPFDIFQGLHRNEDDLWRVEGFDKSVNRRLQNKTNSKRARQKRKEEIQDMRIRIQNLQLENYNLREQKTCRWCHKSLNTYHTHSIEVERPGNISQKNNLTGKQLFFEQVKIPPQRGVWRGKVWLALGLLMLVIGLQIHGLTGSDEKSVKVCQKQAQEWASHFQNPNKGDLKIRMKTKTTPSFSDNKWLGNKAKEKQNWLSSVSFESEQNFALEEEDEELTEIKIDKDLLFSIQAQFDDIGRYI